jgi:hypothetical protein
MDFTEIKSLRFLKIGGVPESPISENAAHISEA